MATRQATLKLVEAKVPAQIEAKNHTYRVDDGPWLPGVTSILRIQDALGGSDGLIRWAVNLAAKAAFDVALRPDNPEFDVALNAAVKATEEARDRGSRIHDGIDAAVRGRDHAPTPRDGALWYHWSRFLLKHRIQPQTEQYIVGDGFGGTYDLSAEIDGVPSLVDVKTGKFKDSFALQLAAYSSGIWQAPKPDFGGVASPVEPVPQFKAFYVLMLSEDGYQLKPIDVGKAELDHFRYLVKTHEQLHAWRKAA